MGRRLKNWNTGYGYQIKSTIYWEQFASVFNQEYYYSFDYDLFQPDSYAVNMSGYSSPNLCSEELWLNVQQYSEDVPIFFDFNSFVKEHEDEYLDKFWSKYKEAQK